jgi:hypothetical protein
MASRVSFLFALSGLALLGACDRKSAEPKPPATPPAVVTEPTASPPVETNRPAPEPAAAANPTSAPLPTLDKGALNERRDPDRVLRFYAQALAARDWAAAARAWGPGSGVTARTLKESYDRADPPRLEIGKGEQDAGAGSIFYEASVTLRFGAGGPAERGSLFLRRVNDVDGATAEQLRWHIERSTIGAGA